MLQQMDNLFWSFTGPLNQVEPMIPFIAFFYSFTQPFIRVLAVRSNWIFQRFKTDNTAEILCNVPFFRMVYTQDTQYVHKNDTKLQASGFWDCGDCEEFTELLHELNNFPFHRGSSACLKITKLIWKLSYVSVETTDRLLVLLIVTTIDFHQYLLYVTSVN